MIIKGQRTLLSRTLSAVKHSSSREQQPAAEKNATISVVASGQHVHHKKQEFEVDMLNRCSSS